MQLNLKVVAGVSIGLFLWFGFIISMAISTGLMREMRMDVEGDKLRWTWPPPGPFKLTRQYRTRNPGTNKPRQMWSAITVGFLCFTAVIALILTAAW